MNGHTSGARARRAGRRARGGLQVEDAARRARLGRAQLAAAGDGARSERAPRRRVASRRAHALATSWTRPGTPRLARAAPRPGRRVGVARRVDARDAAHGVGVERAERERRRRPGRPDSRCLVTVDQVSTGLVASSRASSPTRGERSHRSRRRRRRRAASGASPVAPGDAATTASAGSPPAAYSTTAHRRDGPRPPARPPAGSCRCRRDRLITTSAPTPARARSQRARSHASSRSRPTSAGAAPASSSRGSRGPGLEVERGVLAQDRLVQLAQLGAGLDADLVDQQAAAPRGTPRAPRPGARSDTARASAGRAGARAAGARRRAPRARPPGRRGGRAPGRRRCARSSATARRSSSRAISGCANGSYATSASGGPAPERERLAQPRGRVGRAVVRERAAALAHEPLEAVDVELAVLDAKRVAVARVCRRRPSRSSSARRSWRRSSAAPSPPSPAAPRPTARRSAARSRSPRCDAAAGGPGRCAAALADPDGAVPIADLERPQQAKEHARTSWQTVDQRRVRDARADQRREWAGNGRRWAARDRRARRSRHSTAPGGHRPQGASCAPPASSPPARRHPRRGRPRRPRRRPSDHKQSTPWYAGKSTIEGRRLRSPPTCARQTRSPSSSPPARRRGRRTRSPSFGPTR